ncbi:MAG TPA: FG-GAP repeat protein, partial [Candidatus Binatia bacterium]|nr:FG-GAP repeat protein [Candidatus Binatia bacterium]
MAESARMRWHPKSTAFAFLMLILCVARPTLAGPPFSNCLFTVGQAPTGTAAGDLNGDGLQDLAVTNFTSNMMCPCSW